jgi:hypothetical protein
MGKLLLSDMMTERDLLETRAGDDACTGSVVVSFS